MLRSVVPYMFGATVGATVAYRIFYRLIEVMPSLLPPVTPNRYGWVVTGLGAAAGALLTPLGKDLLRRSSMWTKRRLQQVPAGDLAAGAFGLIVGLLIAALVSLVLPPTVPLLDEYLPPLLALVLAGLGASTAVAKKEEFGRFFSLARPAVRAPEAGSEGGASNCKILDTSVIIDGRIADIARTGFLEGTLVVPAFVLRELQQIADSSDVLKRNRGRRGLDILRQMQSQSRVRVEVVDRDFDDISGVDAKLVRLAKQLGGQVVTNDFNLNKVAELHGVSVLNINELANALKPVVLPGEEMVVHVLRDGKEHGQGVAYLDDGTMIVVDGGRRHIGHDVDVVVTSVLQTSAGRMIFAKPIEVPVMAGSRSRAARDTG